MTGPGKEGTPNVFLLVAVILLGAALAALPVVVTGDPRCFIVKTWECRFWWVP